MTTSQPLRIGILGTANIARAFTAACAPSKDVAITSVASRGLDKAEAFAREVNIPRALGSYEDLLTDPDLDAVHRGE